MDTDQIQQTFSVYNSSPVNRTISGAIYPKSRKVQMTCRINSFPDEYFLPSVPANPFVPD